MINVVGGNISEQILGITGKEVFQGSHYKNGVKFKKVSSNIRPIMSNTESKLADSIHDALVKYGVHDGIVISFHYHFKDGDKVVNMAMEETHKMGLRDITICTSSLGKAHAPLAPMIEDGTVTNIESLGVRGAISKAISQGKLKGLAIMHSHGGHVRTITIDETHTDVAFIGTPTCDDYGNYRGIGGKADCGVLSCSRVGGNHADKIVAITDCLVPFPNYPAHIPMQRADYVCVIGEIGDLMKIATGAARPTTDQRKLLMAEYRTQIVTNTPSFKNGFSYQTGIGGASATSTASLTKIMEDREIKMGFGVGDLTRLMCDFLERGMVRCLLGIQDFDLDTIKNAKNPNRFRTSAGACANPFNKGPSASKLGYVILAALEVDVNFNCSIIVGSDGVIAGAQGGHPGITAGAKCTIVLTPLLQGRIPVICFDVTTVTIPGESIDIVVTDYGVAVSLRRPDLLEVLEAADRTPLKMIQELYDIAYPIVGEPEKVQLIDRTVGIIRARNDTVMDVVRQIEPFEFAE